MFELWGGQQVVVLGHDVLSGRLNHGLDGGRLAPIEAALIAAAQGGGRFTSRRGGCARCGEPYNGTSAIEFSSLVLKAVRDRMIERGWCRPNVNKAAARGRKIFK